MSDQGVQLGCKEKSYLTGIKFNISRQLVSHTACLFLLLSSVYCAPNAFAEPQKGPEERQVWLLNRSPILKLPFKICEIKGLKSPKVGVKVALDSRSLTLVGTSAQKLKSLEVTYDPNLPSTLTDSATSSHSCAKPKDALIILSEQHQDRLKTKQTSVFDVSLHVSSGGLLVKRPSSFKDQPSLLTLIDKQRVVRVVQCEQASCLMTLTASEIQTLSSQLFKRSMLESESTSRSRLITKDGSHQIYMFDGDIPLREGDVFNVPLKHERFSLNRLSQIRFELTSSLALRSKVEAAQEPALLPLSHSKFVEEVQCTDAHCVLDAKGIQIFALDRSVPRIKIKLTLRQGVERISGRVRSKKEVITLPVERCSVKVPDIELLGGIARHHLPIAVAKSCFVGKPRELKVKTWPPVDAYIMRELPSDHPRWRFFDAVLERLPRRGRSLELLLFSRGASETLLGEARLPVAHDFRPAQLRLMIDRLGIIDFLPTNQEATLRTVFEDPKWSDHIQVLDHFGFYRVLRDKRSTKGEVKLKSAPDAKGIIPLRMSYIPSLNPPFDRLSSFQLAEILSEVRFPLRDVNLPQPLSQLDAASSITQVTCLGSRGNLINIVPGVVQAIPYENRHSCRVLVNRGKVPKWSGTQHLLIKAGKRFRRLVRVRHGVGVISVHIPADKYKQFEKLSIRVGHDYSSANYDFSSQEDLGEEARYEVVLGDRSFNINISTALPTGLYRFGVDEGESDNVSLSAGGLARLIWLYKEGKAFPLGLDFGVLGTEINESPHLSFVGGLGLSVPVLNANTPLEASFNLHAWIEYAPTRTGPNESVWGLLFGPSFAVGKFSTQL